MLEMMIEGFPIFLTDAAESNPMKGEYLLPIEVDKYLKKGIVSVKVLEAADKWYGVTYKEDKQSVYDALAEMKNNGKYPQKLWK